MTDMYALLMVAIMALITFLLRFIPFLAFPADKKTPAVITYLSNALPCAIMGMLVIYCLKDVSLFTGNHGIPEAICVILVVLIHKWKHNSLLSIFVGTVVYMLLIQMVF
ncbi:MAG: AzlD domain-containing protein [Bacillota bacterium]|nr:AzlD domain-containing protein [Bacillota bacterium]